MKACEDVKPLLVWLLNGSLGSQEKFDVFQHLSTCGHCRQELAEWTLLSQAAEQTAKPVDQDRRNRLFSRIMARLEEEGAQTTRTIRVTSLIPVHNVMGELRSLYRAAYREQLKSVKPAVQDLQAIGAFVRRIMSHAG
jgi:anti-sigma factor ChrR (cupin superfamily)